MDALSATRTPPEGICCEPKRRCEIDIKGFEIAAVDADQVASGIQRPLQFFFVVHLTQNVQLVSQSAPGKRDQFLLLE
jgi:hypothetical protein